MPRKVLLIQDDAGAARKVREALIDSSSEGFEVEWIRSCAEGLRRLIEEGSSAREPTNELAAILLDLSQADSAGIATFDQFFEATPQTPFLVLCDANDEDVAKLAMQHGAQDYLLKIHIDGYLLPKTLRSMIERATIADALFDEKERAQVTLNSIGDAVMSSDVWGRVTYMNVVAEGLTGWSREEASGRALDEVLKIIDASTREPVGNPLALAIRENRTVGLSRSCVLIRRDGSESAIEDSAAPIHDRHGHVTGAVMVFHDVTTTREMSLRMAHLAQHDSLTDLPNRIVLSDRLTQAISMAHRHGTKLALLFLDLDRFKHVNDSLGHTVGDRVLQSVAQRLLSCMRTSDTVSRQGGDEFVILLAEVAQLADAGIAAEKILLALRAPHHIEDYHLHLSASIGIVTYPEDGSEAETLLKNADFAMYQAKESGRDNFQFFKTEMNVRAVERQFLENDLRHALERHEFSLHYQPIVDLTTGEMPGIEALVRWRHPQRGLVSPGQFIPIAEECGLIVPMGRWILREVCRQARAWQLAGQPQMSVSVNTSAVELRARNFVADVATILAETHLQPRCLELELTETFLMQDSTSTAIVLRALKDLGVRLALDDFGTGYSSLSYLKRFPIDTLKIDRSFVRGLTMRADDACIVNAVISMGSSLNMLVVAEGIETREQLTLLRERGCPQGQGYYFSHPMDADQLTQLLASRGDRRPFPLLLAS